MAVTSHHQIRQILLNRIQSGEWPLGSLIPGEMQLAEEYGCARTTVNRALRSLAEEGLVIRKRKGGTRVRTNPVRQAKLAIPVLREQVEAAGKTYQHKLVSRKLKQPPSAVRTQLGLPNNEKAFFIETLHMADKTPHAFEARWVNLSAVPEIEDAPLEEISVNEFLVRSMPFSAGKVSFSAMNARNRVAKLLGIEGGTSIMVMDRTTWLEDQFITTLKLYFNKGYRLESQL